MNVRSGRYLNLAVCALLISGLFPMWGDASSLSRSRDKRIERAKQEAAQEPVTPADFLGKAVFVHPNQTGADATKLEQGLMFRATIPAEVQLQTKFSDGRDFAVFNADGEALPFITQHWAMASLQNEIAIDKFYPLWGKEKSTADELVLSFTVDKDARIVPKISDVPGSVIPEGQVLKGYIIPLEETVSDIQALTFAWEKGEQPSTQFTIQTGSDLKNWHTVVSQASLVRFEGPAGEALESSTVEMRGIRLQKYMRIIFDEGFAPAAMTKMTIIQRSSEKRELPFGPVAGVESMQSMKGPSAPKVGVLDYILPASPQAGGTIALLSMQVATPPPGFYSNVLVYTRANEQAAWRSHGQFTLFAVMKDGKLTQNAPITLRGDFIGQVRLVPAKSAEPLPKNVSLTFSYTPIDMYFLAMGKGPYSLFWHGERGGVEASNAEILQLITDGSWQAVELQVQEQLTAAPSERKAADAMGDVDWKQYGLWGLLVLGVVGLGFMALQVGRSMKKDGTGIER